MKKGLFLLASGLLLAGLHQLPVRADNCNPLAVYDAPPTEINALEEIYAATIVGNSSCRVYLYSPNDSGDFVKLRSYGLVGDRIHVYSFVYGWDNEIFYQVYFPSSDFWAWLPEEYVRID